MTHNLSNKSVYPQYHRFVTNRNKLYVFSSVPVNQNDLLYLNDKAVEVVSVDKTEEPANNLIDGASAIKAYHSFYQLTIKEEL